MIKKDVNVFWFDLVATILTKCPSEGYSKFPNVKFLVGSSLNYIRGTQGSPARSSAPPPRSQCSP